MPPTARVVASLLLPVGLGPLEEPVLEPELPPLVEEPEAVG